MAESQTEGDGGDAFSPELLKSPAGRRRGGAQGVLSHIWQDTIGFAGLKMIRRILGLAHVEDLESISNPEIPRRVNCKH